MEKQDKQLLQEAVGEIKHLRQQNNYMAARLQMFDDMILLLKTEPASFGGLQSPDVAYSIENRLAQLEVEN